MIKPLVLAFCCFVLFLLIHSTYFHLGRPSQRARSLFITYLAGAGLYALAWLLTPEEGTWASILRITEQAISLPSYYTVLGFIVGWLIYTLCFIGYLEFYFTADRSISFMILIHLEKEAHTGATLERLARSLNLDGYFRRRFDDLVYGGYLRLIGSTYHNTSKGRMFARLYGSIIKYLRLQEE